MGGHSKRAALLGLVAISGVAGCGAPLPPLQLGEGCQPLLGGSDCLLPYPSDFFLVPDSALPSGKKVSIGSSARLVAQYGASADLHGWRAVDGFSRVPSIVAMFPSAVSSSGLVGILDDPAASIQPTSSTLIIDAETGERIAHFADLDPRATDPARQALVLHPHVMLREKARYVVVLQNIRGADGSPVATPEGFRRIREGQASGDAVLEPLAERYKKDVFPVLEGAGVDKKNVQLAWDFTTRSDAHATSDLLRVRELTLQWLATRTPKVEVKQIVEDPNSQVWRIVRGTVTGPLFLKESSPGGLLHRGSDAQVAQNGEARFEFSAVVPNALKNRAQPGRSLAYGHGFFGDLSIVENAGYLAAGLESVLFGVEWWGMSTNDVVTVADGLTSKPFQTMGFTDRIHQGMANWLVFTAAIKGQMKDLGAFQNAAQQVVFDAQPRHFIGISQGHILGGTLAALSQDLDRIALHVGGAGFSTFMLRARPFEMFLFMLEQSLRDPLDQQKYLATSQVYFDRIDPATYAPFVLQRPLPGSPADRRVLMQAGLGDVEVPNVGTYFHARALGVPLLAPSPAEVYGLEKKAGPLSGSALSLFDFGVDLKAAYGSAKPAAEPNPVHDTLRFQTSTLQQLNQFFQANSAIISPCAGACDPN
jgi:hypothetical protein